jgi:hypothetical protein
MNNTQILRNYRNILYLLLCQGTGVIIGFIFLTFSPIAVAHGGHGDEFQGGDTAIANSKYLGYTPSSR